MSNLIRQHGEARFSAGSATVTLDSAPPENSLIVLTMAHRAGVTDAPTATGFTNIYTRNVLPADSTFRRGISQWFKIAGTSEGLSFTGSWPGADAGGFVLVEVYPVNTWSLIENATNDTGTTASVTSITSGTTTSLPSGTKVVLGTVVAKDGTSAFTGFDWELENTRTTGPAELGGLSLLTNTGHTTTTLSGQQSFSSSWTSPTVIYGATAGIVAFGFVGRKVLITDLKSPNLPNSAIADATGVQVKLWFNKQDVGTPDFFTNTATITSGTMEVDVSSVLPDSGDTVLGVAKWTVTGTDYFFPIDTTVEEEGT